MSNKQNTPSLADLIKSQTERQLAEKQRQEKIADLAKIEENKRRAKWDRMLSYAEVAVAEMNNELNGTGVSLELITTPADDGIFSYGSIMVIVNRKSGSTNEWIEFRSSTMGFIDIRRPQSSGIAESHDIRYDDADDALGREIRMYLTKAFSA